MPISGPSSYVPTVEQFEPHWATADATLGAGNEIVAADGTDQAGLTTKKNALIAKRSDVQSRLNEQEVARGDIEAKKAALLAWLVRFNEKIRAALPGSKWLNALPNVPSQSDGQSKITDPLDDANTLWQQINADPGTPNPVTLLGGYDQATFDTEIAELKAAYTTLNATETMLKVTRQERNDLQDEIYAVLKSYRALLPTFFSTGHAIVETLPRLSPLPGSTPDAVTVTVIWDANNQSVKITWTASTDPNVERYEVRFVAGPNYSSDDESLSGSFLPGDPLEHITLDGISGPGTTASYKVYVVLTTGNEKGSNAVSVTQPQP